MSVNRLGKGLEALIRPKKDQKKKPFKKPVAAKPGITEIPLKDIRPNPNQPRRDFDELERGWTGEEIGRAHV